MEDKADNCKKAIDAYTEALKVYTLERFPMQYAMTQNNLGNALRTLAEVEVERKTQNCAAAREALNAALAVFTQQRLQQYVDMVAGNLKRLEAFCAEGE